MTQLAQQRRLWLPYAVGGVICAGVLLALRRSFTHQRLLAFRAGVITGRLRENARRWHEHIDPGGSNDTRTLLPN